MTRVERFETGTQEPGIAQVQRTMQQAEARHERRRRMGRAVVGVAAVVIVLLVGGVAVFGSPADSESATARPTAAPVQAAVAPDAIEPLAEETSAAPGNLPATEASPEVADKGAEAPDTGAETEPKAEATAPQKFTIDIGDTGYEPSVLQASSGSPISLTVAQGEGCAAGFLMPSLGISKDNSRGDVTFSLGKLKAGTYRFTCAMGMVEGRLLVQ